MIITYPTFESVFVQVNREFAFVNMQKKRAGIIVKRWLVMRDVVDEFEQQIEDQPVISLAERLERNKNGQEKK